MWGIEWLSIVFFYCTCILLSSHYLCVFGDDHVTRYMRADDVVGGASEA